MNARVLPFWNVRNPGELKGEGNSDCGISVFHSRSRVGYLKSDNARSNVVMLTQKKQTVHFPCRR